MASTNIVFGPDSSVGPGSAYQILADQKLDELRSPHAPAYAAVCEDRPDESFFALVCDPSLPARREVTEKLANLKIENVLTPEAWGEVDLPGHPRSFAIVFERPRGKRVAAAMTDTIKPYTAHELLHDVLPPLLATLRIFADIRMAHRAIRPTNLFFRGDTRQLMFGDASSAPAGATQPVAYETIEGGMTLPHCRSPGTSADDLYALGATLIFLLRGQDQESMVDPRELIRLKIESGSFMALVGAFRPPPEVIELLRGLLADDPRDRWTVADMEGWIQGRRLKPRQQHPTTIVATRPFEFGGRGHYMARGVAHAFACDPANAARAIRSSEFEIWLQRSLADETRTASVGAVRVENGTRGGAVQDLRLTARTCIALDPMSPVRYGDFAISIDSFGQALIAAFNGRGSLQTIGEVLSAKLPQSWIANQTAARPELLALATVKPFDMLRRFAEDPRPGYGLERVLYELNPSLACQSPLVQADSITEAGQILKTLEGVAAAKKVSADGLIDRHVAAFIAAHARDVTGDCFDLLNGSPRQRALGTLSILAQLQVAYGPAEVSAIGKLLSSQLTLLLDMFRSRQRRARLEKEITKLAAKGTLSELFWLLTGEAEQGRDTQEFAAARREYGEVEQALLILQRAGPSRPARSLEMAGRLSAMTAMFLAAAVALLAAMQAG